MKIKTHLISSISCRPNELYGILKDVDSTREFGIKLLFLFVYLNFIVIFLWNSSLFFIAKFVWNSLAEYCPQLSEFRIAHFVDTRLKKSNESWFAEIIITHWSVHMDFIPHSKKQTINPLNYHLSLINVVTSVRTAPPPSLDFLQYW